MQHISFVITAVFVILFSAISGSLCGQSDSTVTPIKKENKGFLSLFEEPPGMKPSPRKAMLLSLAVPGAGQVYNKKQWYVRAPIAAGLVGGGVYYYFTARKGFIDYRDALRDRANGIETVYDSNPLATDGRLRELRDANRKVMEQALFGTIIVHLLNGIEAFSTAHLINFDVSEDLSIKIEPTFENIQNQTVMGIGVSFEF